MEYSNLKTAMVSCLGPIHNNIGGKTSTSCGYKLLNWSDKVIFEEC